MPGYAFYHYIFNYKEKLMLKLFSSLIIGSSKAPYKEFHQMQQSLNLISFPKPVGICFAVLQQFSKLKILDSLKNSNNSLTC